MLRSLPGIRKSNDMVMIPENAQVTVFDGCIDERLVTETGFYWVLRFYKDGTTSQPRIVEVVKRKDGRLSANANGRSALLINESMIGKSGRFTTDIYCGPLVPPDILRSA
jgi:hypothetical protein